MKCKSTFFSWIGSKLSNTLRSFCGKVSSFPSSIITMVILVWPWSDFNVCASCYFEKNIFRCNDRKWYSFYDLTLAACIFSKLFASFPIQMKMKSLLSNTKTSPSFINDHDICGKCRITGCFLPFTEYKTGLNWSVTWWNPEAAPPGNNLQSRNMNFYWMGNRHFREIAFFQVGLGLFV